MFSLDILSKTEQARLEYAVLLSQLAGRYPQFAKHPFVKSALADTPVRQCVFMHMLLTGLFAHHKDTVKRNHFEYRLVLEEFSLRLDVASHPQQLPDLIAPSTGTTSIPLLSLSKSQILAASAAETLSMEYNHNNQVLPSSGEVHSSAVASASITSSSRSSQSIAHDGVSTQQPPPRTATTTTSATVAQQLKMLQLDPKKPTLHQQQLQSQKQQPLQSIKQSPMDKLEEKSPQSQVKQPISTTATTTTTTATANKTNNSTSKQKQQQQQRRALLENFVATQAPELSSLSESRLELLAVEFLRNFEVKQEIRMYE